MLYIKLTKLQDGAMIIIDRSNKPIPVVLRKIPEGIQLSCKAGQTPPFILKT